MNRILSCLIVCGIGVAGLPDVNAAPSGARPTGDWVLQTLAGVSGKATRSITLQFAAGRLSGNDGCNRISAGVTFGPRNAVRIGQSIGTLMACPEPVMQFAQQYNNALDRARRYAVQAGYLVLFDDKGRELARFARQSQALINWEWGVLAYNNGRQGVESNQYSETMSISLLPGGEVRGFGGCRTFSGRYTLDESRRRISFGATFVPLSRNGCASDSEQEQKKFEAALRRSSTYRREGNRAELFDSKGALSVHLVVKGWLE